MSDKDNIVDFKVLSKCDTSKELCFFSKEAQGSSVQEKYPLLDWLLEGAARKGMGIRDLAAELGVTYGYMAQLKSGTRSTHHISRDFSASCARFLKVPRVSILIASGQLSVEDYYPSNECLEAEIDHAINLIRQDPDLSPWFPLSILRADYDVKQFAVIAYEQATSKILLSTRVDVQQVSGLQDEFDF